MWHSYRVVASVTNCNEEKEVVNGPYFQDTKGAYVVLYTHVRFILKGAISLTWARAATQRASVTNIPNAPESTSSTSALTARTTRWATNVNIASHSLLGTRGMEIAV